MSRGTGWSPALLDPSVCQYVVERPPGKPDLHCVNPAGHEDLPIFDPGKPHMVTPEFELEEPGGSGS
jgi:hypothetical protein